MNSLTVKDKERLNEIATALQKIKDESEKDQLVGAAKWAVICKNVNKPKQSA